MQPIPYVFFKGDCAEALRTYATVFGSPDPQIMLNADTPEEFRMPSASGVMHGAVRIGEGWLYGCDDAEGAGMAGASIAVTSHTADESRRIFDALAEGGEVRMPLSPTFWSPGFGMLTDRFGIRWMLDTEGAAMPEGLSGAPAEAVA